MTKKILGCVLLVGVFLAGSYSGFIAGVEEAEEDVARRSVSMGNCQLVFQ